jgi:hypothetical protein
MIEADMNSLRALLREAIAGSRLNTREAEEALGMAHGSLEGVLKGKLELKVRHILALAAVLRVSPADFFVLGCPNANDAAQHELVEWLSPPARRAVRAAPAAKVRTSPGRRPPSGRGDQLVRRLTQLAKRVLTAHSLEEMGLA